MERPQASEASPEASAATGGGQPGGAPHSARDRARRDGWTIAMLAAAPADGAATPAAGAMAAGADLAPTNAAVATAPTPVFAGTPLAAAAEASGPASAVPPAVANVQAVVAIDAAAGEPAVAEQPAVAPSDRPGESAAPAASSGDSRLVADLAADAPAGAASAMLSPVATAAAPTRPVAAPERESDAAAANTGLGALVVDLSSGAAGHAIVVGNDGLEAAALTSGIADDSSAVALAVPTADEEYFDSTGGTLDGAGLRIGILSDSFNYTGGMAADIADGDLPPASQIHIVEDGVGADEGRAMAELVYQIAPAAQIYFYTATNGESDFANGITTLATTDHCNVIVDDVIYQDEPFYQDTGVITQAVENAISLGVNYFTAAGNQYNNFYEAAFDPLPSMFMLPGVSGALMVHDVSGGSPYEAVNLYQNFPTLDFTVQWTEPFGASRYQIGMGLFVDNGGTYTLVDDFANSTTDSTPELSFDGVVPLASGTYYLAFYESSSELVGGSPITPGTFKIIFFQDSNAFLAGWGVGAGIGSGTSVGHELVPEANTVGAVNIADTPPRGGLPPQPEPFSAYGPGETFIDAAGTPLAVPYSDGKPDFLATDGTPTSVFNPFRGTSAAAPNAGAVALLLLQADSRLAPAQVTYLLEASAIRTGNTLNGGAGLIQASTAVEGALSAADTPIWTAQDGTTLWNDPLNWSDSAVPGPASSVEITNGLGMFTGAYAVEFNEASDAVAALTLDGGGSTSVRPDLRIDAADVLTTGSLTLGAGTIDVFGSLADSGALLAGSATGAITVEGTGRLSIGGGVAASDIVYGGTGGDVVFATAASPTLVAGLTGSISNFATGDVLDLSGLPVSSVASIDVLGPMVTVLNAANDTLATLHMTGTFTGLGFGEDGGTGTDLFACFGGGTRIATECGEVPVERLRPGQRLRAAAGRLLPLRWLGRSRIARPGEDALPVRIRAGALGGGLPARDLLVSPGHALFLDGVLVQAGALVNGAGVVREATNPEALVYWHIECDSHALLLAEGVAAESFLAGVEPIRFDNWHERLTPTEGPELPYPRCQAARQVPQALRDRLAAWRKRPATAAA